MACKKGSPSISTNPDAGENAFDLLFREHAAIMLLIEPDTGEVLDANQSALDFYGYSRDEIAGSSIHKIQVLSHGESVGGGKSCLVFQHRVANGEVKTVEVYSSLININGKKIVLSVVHDITERKKNEDALKQSESHFQLLSEHMSDTIWLTDMNLRVKYVNPSTELMRGYSLAELQNIPLDKLLSPDSLQKVMRLCAEEIPKIKADKTYMPTSTIELELCNRNGGLDLMELKLSIIRDECGAPVSILGQGRNITERKRVEDDLRQSEARYRALFENSLSGILIMQPDGTVISANPEACRLLCRKEFEVYQLEPGNIFNLSDDRFNLAIKERERTGSFCGELTLIRGDGTTFPADVKSRSFTLPSGQEYINIFFHDITGLKQTEEMIRRSEEKYRTVAEFTYDWESWRAPDGSYLYVSPSCLRITGHTMDEFLNDPGLIYTITHPDDRDKVREHTDLVMGDQNTSNTEFDFRIVTPAGEMRWINHSCTSVFGADGRWLGRRESNRDVSERVRIAQELQKQRDFATQVINAMGQGLTVTDAEGRFEFVNAAYARLFGYEVGELLGKYPRDVTIPEEWGALENQRKLREDGQSSTYESRIQKADGDMAHVLIAAVPRKSDTQNYGGAIAVITDLTEQKRIQDELRKARDAFETANHQLQQALTREQALSHTDGLTGVYNRRYFFELAEKWFGISIRHKQPLSAMMIDIDHFKQVNDEFGHATGDEVIRLVIRSTRDELRSEDVVGRYGGEEFVVILPMTNLEQAKILAERVRALAESLQFPTDKGEARVTLSIGVAAMPVDQKLESVEFLIRNADKAMYIAKQDGRNRVRVYDIENSEP